MGGFVPPHLSRARSLTLSHTLSRSRSLSLSLVLSRSLALACSPFSCSYVYNHWGTMTTGLAKLNPGWRWDSKIKDQFAPALSGAPSTELVDYAVKERSVEQPPIPIR